MRILHIAPEYKWSNIFILPIAQKQVGKKNTVWLSTPAAQSKSKKEILCSGISQVSWNSKYRQILKYICSVFLLIKMVRLHNIKQVYSHTTVDSTLYILGLRLFTSAEIIYVNHGVPYLGYKGIVALIFKICEAININFSHRTIAITDSMKKLLLPFNYTHKKMISLEPGTLVGVNVPYQSYNELLSYKNLTDHDVKDNTKLKILYVGRIEHRKGIYDLLEAVEQTELDCELIVLGGTAEDLNQYYNEAKVTFLGFQTDLSSYYLAADLLCVPSHHEGFGQVYLEAASYGVIPICCNIPGPTDFVRHGENGFIVEPKSPNSITLLLNQIHDGSFNIDKLKENAYESAKVYDSNIVIDNNMSFFK